MILRPTPGSHRPDPARLRRLAGRLASLAGVALLGLVACDDYLAEPGQGEPEAPILENVALSPATVTVLDAPGDLNTAVDARTRSGIDGVTVVLKSPSGNDRLSCDMSSPAEGDAFDGQWTCDLTVAQGSESGMWMPDTIALFSSGADDGVRYFTGEELADAGYEVEVEIISEPPVPTELTVAPESAELPDADSQVTLVATVLDQYGREIPAPPVVWTSRDPAVAAVTNSGVVTPVSVGTTDVVATLDALSDTAVIVVPSTPTVLEVTPDPVALDSIDATVQLAAEVRNQFDDVLAGEPVTWTSADPSVATVDDTGLVTAVGGGVTTVQAQAAGLTTDVLVTVDGGPPLPGFTWTSLSGGSWNDPANWDRGTVPGPADTAYIRLDGSYTVTVNANASVAVLEVENASGRPRLEVAAGTFTVADSAWFGPGSTAILSAGRWDGSGNLVVADSLIWTAGFHSGAGETRLTPTGTLALTGTGTRTLDGRRILQEGAGVLSGGGLSLNQAAELSVAPGATLEMGGATIASSSTGAQVGRLTVDGTLSIPTVLGDGNVGARLVNNGQVQVGPGRLFVTSASGGFQGDGDWIIDVDATLRTAGTPAIAEIGAGATVQGAGTWEIRTDTDILGAVDMDGGIDFGNPGTVLTVNPADTVLVNNLTVGNAGSLSLDPGATVRIRSEFQLGPASVSGGGSLHLPPGTQGRINPLGFTTTLTGGSRIDVGGLLIWEQDGFVMEDGARIDVTGDGELALEADGTLLATGGTLGNPVIVSQGEITRAQGTGTATVQADVTNRGLVTVRTGTLDLDGGFTHEAGALLRGVGTLDLTDTSPVSFQGEIGPGLDFGGAAGALTIQGNLALTGTATLSLELGGTTGGTDADLLDVSGAFAAAGTLDVSGLAGYVPAAGDTIEVLRYTSRTGAFDAVTGLDFAVAGGGEPLDTVFEADRLLLVAPDPVTPPPSLTGVIVFVSDRGGNRDVYVKDLETGTVDQLTDDTQVAGGPEWAPDGSRIAYAAGSIRLINPDGSGLSGITSGTDQFGPTWSPDGTEIVFQGLVGGAFDFLRVEADPPRAVVNLTSSNGNEFYPDWSPDGQRIAWTTNNSGSVVSFRAADAGDLQTHYVSGGSRDPAWSPDGTEIAFSEAVAGGWRIQVVNVTTGDVREVVNDGTTNWYPRWSPDGEYILYSKNPDFVRDDFDLYAVRADGSGDQILVEASPGDDFQADWTAEITVPVGNRPFASISAPADGSVFSPGESITFQGSASDAEDGALTGASLTWSSSIDGDIGIGQSLTVSSLSQGDHLITLTATDSDGRVDTDRINLTVAPQADLSVAMTVTPDSLAVGDTLTHTVTVTNGGPDAADSVDLSLLVEGDVLFAFVNEEGCGNFLNDNPPEKLFQCPLGTLAAGTDTTLTLRVIPQAAELLISTADVSGFANAVDPDAGDRVVSENTPVTGAGGGTAVPTVYGLIPGVGVQVIDALDLSSGASTVIPLAVDAERIERRPGTNEIWVTEGSGGGVTIIDAASNAVVGQFNSGAAWSSEIEFDASGSIAAISDIGALGAPPVILDAETRTVLGTVPQPESDRIRGLELSGDGATGWFAGGDVVARFDATTRVVEDFLVTTHGTTSAALRPDEQEFWVYSEPDGWVYVYDAATLTELAVLTVGPRDLTARDGAITFTGDGGTAFVSNVNPEIARVDTGTGTVTILPVAAPVERIALDEAQGRAFVSERRGDEVFVIDLATGSTIQRYLTPGGNSVTDVILFLP